MLSRSFRSTTQVLGILALGVLTACGGGGAGAPSTPPLRASQAAAPQAQLETTLASASRAARSSYATIYSFTSNTAPGYPNGGLIAVNGTLYGTTSAGGVNGGAGTVFKVSP